MEEEYSKLTADKNKNQVPVPKTKDYTDLLEKLEFLVAATPDCFKHRTDRNFERSADNSDEFPQVFALMKALENKPKEISVSTLFKTNLEFKNYVLACEAIILDEYL